jgi:hypothetical protein
MPWFVRLSLSEPRPDVLTPRRSCSKRRGSWRRRGCPHPSTDDEDGRRHTRESSTHAPKLSPPGNPLFFALNTYPFRAHPNAAPGFCWKASQGPGSDAPMLQSNQNHNRQAQVQARWSKRRVNCSLLATRSALLHTHTSSVVASFLHRRAPRCALKGRGPNGISSSSHGGGAAIGTSCSSRIDTRCCRPAAAIVVALAVDGRAAGALAAPAPARLRRGLCRQGPVDGRRTRAATGRFFGDSSSCGLAWFGRGRAAGHWCCL